MTDFITHSKHKGPIKLEKRPMNLNDFQAKARETAVYPGQETFVGLMYCALKLNGEAGEFAEKIGKILRDQDVYAKEYAMTEEDGTYYSVFRAFEDLPENVKLSAIDELGDILWYIANAAYEMNVPLELIAQRNYEKLQSRKDRGKLQGEGDTR